MVFVILSHVRLSATIRADTVASNFPSKEERKIVLASSSGMGESMDVSLSRRAVNLSMYSDISPDLYFIEWSSESTEDLDTTEVDA
jgi:hypothetical protein